GTPRPVAQARGRPGRRAGRGDPGHRRRGRRAAAEVPGLSGTALSAQRPVAETAPAMIRAPQERLQPRPAAGTGTAPAPPRGAPSSAAPLRAPVRVLVTDDVVVAQVTARLHFDQLERLGPRVLQPVPGAQRDVGRLVGVQLEYVVVAGHARGA